MKGTAHVIIRDADGILLIDERREIDEPEAAAADLVNRLNESLDGAPDASEGLHLMVEGAPSSTPAAELTPATDTAET